MTRGVFLSINKNNIEKRYTNKEKDAMNKMTRISLVFATAFVLFGSLAANAVLNMGGKTIFTGTLIEVLEPGPDIQAIIDNITDASATRPYLIHLGAGVYDLGSTNIVMKPWVSIQGSGRESTTITGAVSTGIFDNSSAVMVSANNVALSDMTIENTGGDQYSTAIFNINVSPRMERLTAISTGGTLRNIAVYNSSITSASPIMTDISAFASGNTNNRAVVNATSSPIMLGVSANASGGTESNNGVLNKESSAPTMITVYASATGGTKSRGVKNDASSPTMMGVTASASGGSVSSHGVFNKNSSSPFIQDSILMGDTRALRVLVDSPGTRIVNSMVTNGIKTDATDTKCLGNYDETLATAGC